MKRKCSISNANEISIAAKYHELQRLRKVVQQAERNSLSERTRARQVPELTRRVHVQLKK